jgi:hypothetical protein
MLSWYVAVGYGALGGLIVEAVVLLSCLRAWQDARHLALPSKGTRPALGEFIDPCPDLAVAGARALLGCVVGLLLHGELTGVYAAVAVGASAPGLLAQFGRAATSGNEDDKIDAQRVDSPDTMPPLPAGDALAAPKGAAE